MYSKIISGVSIDKSYQILEKGSTLTSVCTVTGDSTVDIKWRINATDGGTDTDLTSSAQQQAYNNANRNRVSTLSIANVDDSDNNRSYECYVIIGQAEFSDTLRLDVVGMFKFFYSQMLLRKDVANNSIKCI